MAIISLSGSAGSGKDTIGEIIRYLIAYEKRGGSWSYPKGFKLGIQYTESEWQIKKFADKLKDVASLLTGVPIEKWEDQEFKKLTFEDLNRQGLISKQFYDNLPDG